MAGMLDPDEYESCCGCCGLPIGDEEDAADADLVWCVGCQEHVLDGTAFWEATYFAQHGEPCPLSVDFEGHLDRIDTMVRRFVEGQ